MKFSFAIIASLVAVASASTIVSATTSTVENIVDDIAKAGKQFARIDDLVKKFPQNGVKGAEEIHNHGVELHTIFNGVISAINSLPKPVSAADANKIVDAYISVTPADISSSNEFAAKEPDFVALSASAASTAKSDLVLSDLGCQRLATTLNSITPPDMVDSLATTIKAVDAARTSAIAAFP